MKNRIFTLGICLAILFGVIIGSRFYCANGFCVGFTWGENGEPITIVEHDGNLFECYADNIAIGDCKIVFDNNGTENVRDDRVLAIF